jgi:chemotaxis family two-component system sensor kinase Cph1
MRPPVDLTACDTEPIHLIGAIQPHGVLVAADERTLRIDHVSANCAELLGRSPAELLATPLSGLFGPLQATEIDARAQPPLMPELLRPWFVDIDTPGGPRRLECFPHRHDGRIVLEFVPFDAGPALVWEEDLLRQRIIAELIKPDTLTELARASAQILREVTGFDRVMIYRFAEDGHGEVIAESTVRDDSFLGLHYPASDIPEPARRHFRLNVIRSIPDIMAQPVPILTHRGAVADASHPAALDLTYGKLRGVAPVHVEYLGNMGVGGSMSISLIANDDLWGLVACHHYGPLHLPWSRFRFCELLGGTISALLQSLENATQLRQSIRAERSAFEIERAARGGRPLVELIAQNARDLMQQAGAQGMVLSLGGVLRRFGRTPEPLPDLRRLGHAPVDGVSTFDNVPSALGLAPAHWSIASGAAYLELSDDGEDYLVFLREEFEHTIQWAGKPGKLEQRRVDGTVRLSPRGSFALWSEERRGRSQPFSDSDREALRILRRALFALNSLDRERAAVQAQKQAEAEEARLRLLVLDAARRSSMGELASALAHELNQPLAAVTNYVNACRQELRNYGVAIPSDVNGLIERAVGESLRAAELVRRLRNFIAQGEIVAEPMDLRQVLRQGVDLALAASQDPQPTIVLELDGVPSLVMADPIQIGQVVLNLVRNSLAAMRASEPRRLTISAQRRKAFVEVSVRDTGHGIPAEIVGRLFEAFQPSTSSGMGLGLSLCRSIVEAHGGRIWSRPVTQGAEIVFSLPVRSP